MRAGEYASAVQRRAWRFYADTLTRVTRRGSAREGLASFGDPDRSAPRIWNERLSERHAEYRRDHALVSTSASVVCVSRRPQMLDEIVANTVRQVAVDIELVLVTNDRGFDNSDIDRALSPIRRARHIATDPDASLGECLNLGLGVATERFVAKFDDDDYYGPNFLSDSLRAHGYAGAGVVGKHTYYAEFTASGDRYLRFPGHEFSYSSTLAGGTLVIDRDRVGDLGFTEVSLGEDRAFISACHRRGVSTFAADRFSFLQRRGAENTWAISEEQFRKGSEAVDPGDPAHRVDQ